MNHDPPDKKIPTESRIFANKLTRDLRALERTYAERLAPGKTTWTAAGRALCEKMRRADGPVKRVKQIRAAYEVLRAVSQDPAFPLCIHRFWSKSRSAHMEWLTLEVDNHPYASDVEGIAVRCNGFGAVRNGDAYYLLPHTAAFIPWHALGRLHQRHKDLEDACPSLLLVFCGLAAVMMLDFGQYFGSELNIVADNVIATGVLRKHDQRIKTSYPICGAFFDVKTVLDQDMVSEQQLQHGTALSTALRFLPRNEEAAIEYVKRHVPVRPYYYNDYVGRTINPK
jgi:hypothetical protein